jgi:crotonobetainyl-CoA:carnitine CoA-transferase CaiB-like acyl-CoA transferase
MAAPFHDVRVVDLTDTIAGAYCAKLLADAGAEVLHVEPDAGAPLRRHGWGERSGLLFSFLRGGQRSAQLRDADTAAVAARGDLVLTSAVPGELAARGLDWATLHATAPAVTMVAITPFGWTGPWAGRAATEFTLLAAGGSTATRGRPGRPFINGGGRVGEYVGGVSAACAAAAALRRARATGIGDLVDVSLLEAVTPTCSNVQSLWGSMSGLFEARPLLEIPSIEPTADGYVGFCVFTGQQWQDFCVLIGAPDLADDPGLATMGGRIERGAEVIDRIHAYTTTRTTAEVVEEASLLRIPVAFLGNGATLPAFDHFVERGVYVEHPGGGFLQPRVPWRIHGDPVEPPRRAPQLGEHTAEVRAALHEPAPPPAGPADLPMAADAWPLAGLRVLDLTAFWAGPYATFTLACLGADVIHVESVQRPDGMRFGSVRTPGSEQWWEWGPTFHSANAGKRSVTLDLTRDVGRALLRRLVEQCDILVENFAPRVFEQWGLDWDTLRSWNPKIVVVRMPAFGLDGPWRDRVGFAQTMEQTSGMAWLTGYADLDPMNARGPCDPLAGMHAAFAAIAGVAQRAHTGSGCLIEATMVETALNAAAEQVIEWTGNGVLLSRDANHEPPYGLQGTFTMADHPEGTMGAIAVAAADSGQRATLGRLVGVDLTGEPEQFDDALAAWCATRPLHDTVELLAAHGVPAAAVSGSRTSDRNPQVGSRGFFVEVEHTVIGTHRIPSFPVVFGRQPAARFARPAPLLGEHNEEVLGGLLGCTPTELTAFEADRLIGTRPLGA